MPALCKAYIPEARAGTRAERANTEVQIRLLLELVDEMVKNSLPEWMS